MSNIIASKSKVRQTRWGCVYAIVLAVIFFVMGLVGHELINEYYLPDMLERQYYRGTYDVCVQSVRSAEACNMHNESILRMDWYGQPSKGFEWPIQKPKIKVDGQNG